MRFHDEKIREFRVANFPKLNIFEQDINVLTNNVRDILTEIAEAESVLGRERSRNKP